MNVPQFRKWLNRQIEYLAVFDEIKLPGDVHYVEEIIRDAQVYAAQLGLSDSAAACMHGPPLTRLMECLNAIPEPERDTYTLNEAADKLRVSRRTVGLPPKPVPQVMRVRVG